MTYQASKKEDRFHCWPHKVGLAKACPKYHVKCKNTIYIQKCNTMATVIITFQFVESLFCYCWHWTPVGMMCIYCPSHASVVCKLCTTAGCVTNISYVAQFEQLIWVIKVLHTYIDTCMHTYIPTYIHTYIHTV